MELERLKEKIKPKEVKRPDHAPVYHTDSYKKEVSKSIDWAQYKNTMIPEAKKKPEFIKIDYLRFDNKKEYQDLKEAKTGQNTRAHTSMDELGAQMTTKLSNRNAAKSPADNMPMKKSESTQALNTKKARFQTLDQPNQSGAVIPIYKIPHKQRNQLKNSQTLNRGDSASSGEAGFDHYMATPDKNPAKGQRLQKVKDYNELNSVLISTKQLEQKALRQE